MSEVQQKDMAQRMEHMERTLRNVRIAVIIIAAFFLYEAFAPLGFGRDGFEVMDKVKLKELVVLDDQNRVLARFGTGEKGARLVLDGENGERLQFEDGEISIMVPGQTGRIEQVRLDANGLSAYDRAGNLLNTASP